MRGGRRREGRKELDQRQPRSRSSQVEAEVEEGDPERQRLRHQVFLPRQAKIETVEIDTRPDGKPGQAQELARRSALEGVKELGHFLLGEVLPPPLFLHLRLRVLLALERRRLHWDQLAL